MKLVIAEKGKLARDIARAICGKTSVNDKTPLPITGNGYTVCALSGHVLELVEPQVLDSRWDLASGAWEIKDLPIWFPNWPRDIKRAVDENGKKTSEPDGFAQSRIDLVAELLPQAECVIHAGDPDDEGQFLVDEVLEYLDWHGKTYRVYVNDSLEKNIILEFQNLKDNEKCKGDGLAAYARAMADAAFGYNESRLLSSRLHISNASLGRVQTPVLGLVVTRDRAIENHTEQLYYELNINIASNDIARQSLCCHFVPNKAFIEANTSDGKHILDKEALLSIAQQIEASSPFQMDFKDGTERKHPPIPYNITSLESEMNKRYGYPAAKTLAITQSLRDSHSAITYNRSSSGYLKTQHWQEAQTVLSVAMKNIGVSWELDFSIKSKAFNDNNVSAHHGIIPQEISLDVAAMSQEERNVYHAIVERYAMQFMGDAVYSTCTGEAEFNQGILRYRAKKIIEQGWLKAHTEDDDTNETDEDFFVTPGVYTCKYASADLIEKTTTPPKHYTEGTLVKDMSQMAKYVQDPTLKQVLKDKDANDPEEHGGIGTAATRPLIIETLKKRGFIEERGKYIVSTARGRAVWDIVPNDIRNGAEMTARWYVLQEDIRCGNASVNALGEDVISRFLKHRDTAYIGISVPDELKAASGRTIIGTCPRCGLPVYEAKSSYQCSSNRFEKDESSDIPTLVSGCGFRMLKVIAKKRLTSTQAQNLILGKRVKLKGLSKKDGGTFDAYATLKSDKSGDIEFSFDDMKKQGSRKHRTAFKI